MNGSGIRFGVRRLELFSWWLKTPECCIEKAAILFFNNLLGVSWKLQVSKGKNDKSIVRVIEYVEVAVVYGIISIHVIP